MRDLKAVRELFEIIFKTQKDKSFPAPRALAYISDGLAARMGNGFPLRSVRETLIFRSTDNYPGPVLAGGLSAFLRARENQSVHLRYWA